MNRKRGQRGRAQTTFDLFETCRKIIEPVWPITVRGVCYRLFVAGVIPDMSTASTQKISRVLKMAREEDLIPWSWIVDETRELERSARWIDLEAFADAIEDSYRRDFWSDQKFRVILISEKSTIQGILRPILDHYGVPFLSVHGFSSATVMHDLARAIHGDMREHALLYIGDWDPSGLYMSEVDLPARLVGYGAVRFDFKRIALIAEDLESLPFFDVHEKRKDPRYSWFIERYGYRAWELDAMSPNDLRDRVEGEILKYLDTEAWKRHLVVEEAQRESTRQVAEQLRNIGME